MKKIIFYYSWLSLDKSELKILTMVAEMGSFSGSLTDICRWLSISPDTRNRNQIKTSLTNLSENDYISYSRSGNTHAISIVPKEGQIDIPDFTLEKLKTVKHPGISIDWINLLKLYLFIQYHSTIVTTYTGISEVLNISETTLGNAKAVLEKNFNEIAVDKIKKKQADGSYWVVGQEFSMGADFTKI